MPLRLSPPSRSRRSWPGLSLHRGVAALGAARLVSTPSRRSELQRAWLGIAISGFPEFEQFYIPGFPGGTQSSLSPLRLPFRHARTGAPQAIAEPLQTFKSVASTTKYLDSFIYSHHLCRSVLAGVLTFENDPTSAFAKSSEINGFERGRCFQFHHSAADFGHIPIHYCRDLPEARHAPLHYAAPVGAPQDSGNRGGIDFRASRSTSPFAAAV